MASLVKSYEQQFSTLTAEITQRIGTISLYHGAEKKSLISTIERQLDEAQELLEQMDLEVRELSSAERGKLMGRLKSYQHEFNNLESQIKKAKTSSINKANQMREELLGMDEYGNDDQKTRLLDNTERLENSSRRLEIGYRVATETEKIGQDILDNLHRDRETINRSRQRLREGDEHLGKGSRILSGMMRRIIQNRILTLAIIVFLIIVIAVVVYITSNR
uniref:Vesicle transport through interaction with t-SNAREs homolog 1A n=1 Tax=Phallusia mammillata TaxID=59560 RepID=A0A6F9DXF9_9ASCI|nr:vesicle transport through interaction with t-SNAREs homolog 1A-like [Phallusia mammillata]